VKEGRLSTIKKVDGGCAGPRRASCRPANRTGARDQIKTINALVQAVDGLSTKLEQAEGLPRSDQRYIDARERLSELNSAIEMLKRDKIQPALAALDMYSGNTVNDLRMFMLRHNLEFAEPSSPKEQKLFPELNAMLRGYYEMLKAVAGEKTKE